MYAYFFGHSCGTFLHVIYLPKISRQSLKKVLYVRINERRLNSSIFALEFLIFLEIEKSQKNCSFVVYSIKTDKLYQLVNNDWMR